jgi:hypothetical protein
VRQREEEEKKTDKQNRRDKGREERVEAHGAPIDVTVRAGWVRQAKEIRVLRVVGQNEAIVQQLWDKAIK